MERRDFPTVIRLSFAASSTIRASGMSRKRYTLRRANERRNGRSQSGLNLLVHDAYTNEERPVQTCFGGEGFTT